MPVSAPHEQVMVLIQLRELAAEVDAFVLTEFDRTHSGLPKPFYFDTILEESEFSAFRPKVHYLKFSDHPEVIVRDERDLSSHEMHANEQIMRNAFAEGFDLSPEDTVLAVDADEIMYRRSYRRLVSILERWPGRSPSLLLQFRLFFYRPDWLWEDEKFVAPVLCRASRFLGRRDPQWRQEGLRVRSWVGAHFSWHLTTEDMATKLRSYAHARDYGHLAQQELLQESIQNKCYPFEPARRFTIKHVHPQTSPHLYPQILVEDPDLYQRVFPQGWIH